MVYFRISSFTVDIFLRLERVCISNTGNKEDAITRMNRGTGLRKEDIKENRITEDIGGKGNSFFAI